MALANRVSAGLSRVGSKSALLHSNMPQNRGDTREYPTKAEDYDLIEECGQGAGGKVWRALCKPFNSFVAVKLLDLDSVSCNLEEIMREVQIMKLVNHENILSLHCSFVHQENLWMVMPYVKGGSVLNIMKFAYLQGLDEPVIATILKEVLKALDYVHKQGAIHRDVKAGNILLGHHGEVKLADFGVAATMDRDDSKRSTFVGTPCWMAPEVMDPQAAGYDSKADIWSFGITVLEMAHGMAPFAKYPPMKVLMMTLQNAPPTLQQTGDKTFSKEMQQLVALCLVKDPSKRPTAARLLEHRFFKSAHDSNYLMKHVLADLPPLTERVKQMRANKTGPGSMMEKKQAMELSQQEYVKGVSSWNFDVADLKAQAALLPDEDEDGWDFDPAPRAPAPQPPSSSAAAPPPAAPAAASKQEQQQPKEGAAAKPPTGASAGLSVDTAEAGSSGASPVSGPPYSPSKGEAAGEAAGKISQPGERKGRFQIVSSDPELAALHHDQSASVKPPEKEKEAMLSPSVASAAASGALVRQSSYDQEPGGKKRVSRFNIISNDESGLPPKPTPSGTSSMSRAGSSPGLARSEETAAAPSVPKSRLEAVLPHLEMMLKVHQKQGDELNSIVSAMVQASTGKPEALQRLAGQNPSAHLERLLHPESTNPAGVARRELDRAQNRIRELQEENQTLKHDNEKLKQKLQQSRAALMDDA